MMKRVLLLLVFLIIAISPATLALAQKNSPLINTIRIEGPIDPATAIYVHRSIGEAEENGAQAVVILIETPGGLMDSMQKIVQDFYASRVPIVVYVWPQGARAASAGAIIALAANIAAMSPGTNMGAAHPVVMGGAQPDKIMATKLENDAAAYARSIATRRGRNVDWAEQVVRKSVSVNENEAKQKNVIDIIAKDQADLLRQINGRKVDTAAGKVTISSVNARVEPIEQTVRERFLHAIDNPNITYILMLLAVYGLIFELSNPGAILPGVVGGIALIMALFSFAVVPVNMAGILLIIFAIALFLIDLHVPTHGILTVGGVISFVCGSLMLFSGGPPGYQISPWLTILMSVLTGGFFIFGVGAGIRAQRKRAVTGAEGMMDQIVEAKTDIDPKGKVFVEGSWWNAQTDGEPIKKGEMVRVIKLQKLTLLVRKEEATPKAGSPE